ncbi:hypothetical protein VDG1235_1534 [Verrucomicrobiia bacterium DG1235]|nr:hypothetical protein VDG1235_1534 [Verrucomicrobiae bacterium DG1235]
MSVLTKFIASFNSDEISTVHELFEITESGTDKLARQIYTQHKVESLRHEVGKISALEEDSRFEKAADFEYPAYLVSPYNQADNRLGPSLGINIVFEDGTASRALFSFSKYKKKRGTKIRMITFILSDVTLRDKLNSREIEISNKTKEILLKE